MATVLPKKSTEREREREREREILKKLVVVGVLGVRRNVSV
jgi:hypothetical protein